MHAIDIAVIAAYLITLVVIGLRFAGKQTTTDRYFVAGRSIPGWAAGLSLLATIITSVTFIAYPGAAYAGDWTLLVPGIMFVVVIAALGPVIVPFFRHVVSMSVYEYFGKRFGQGVRMYASFAFATGHFAKMGFVFYLLALSVSGITGWSIAWIIVGLGIITIFYTLVGGLRGVIWTDVAQGFILWMSVAVTICLLLFSSHAGAGSMLWLIISHHKMDLGGWHFNLAKPTFWTMALYGLFFYLQKYTADQTVVQRYLAAKSDRSSLRGMLMGASLCLPIWTAFMLIGSLLWAFYRITGEALPGTIARPDQVFPHYMVTHMPIGVAGLFLAALFGAAMSMLASDLNCLGLILVEDFYAHFFPRKSDVQRLSFGKLSIVFCGGLAIAVALRLSTTQGSALALYYTATAIVAGGLAGLFLLAFLCRRAGLPFSVVVLDESLQS
jgi:solute:Na+ symporter, SSS family